MQPNKCHVFLLFLQREVQSSRFHRHRRWEEVSVEYSEDCCSDVAGRIRDFSFICPLLDFVQFGRKQRKKHYVKHMSALVSLTSGAYFFTNEPINICGDYLMSA